MVIVGGWSVPSAMTFVFFKLMVNPNSLQACHVLPSLNKVTLPLPFMGELTDKLLQAVLCVWCQGCIICKKHLANQHLCYFDLGTEAGDVKELAVGPGVDVYSLAAVLEGVLEEHGEEYAEERQHKDAALFYPAANRKGLGRWRRWSILCWQCMLLWNDVTTASRCGGQPIFWRSLKSPLLLTKSKAFVKSMKVRYRGICCSRHFPWSWRRENIMSTIDRRETEATLGLWVDAGGKDLQAS